MRKAIAQRKTLIIPGENVLHNLTMNADEMTVNGKKLPDDVLKKYKEKYPRFAKGHLSYGDGGQSYHNGLNIHSNSDE